MIQLEKTEVMNFDGALRGMRNPLNSWDKSDSYINDEGDFVIGEVDLGLAQKLIAAGTDHSKFMRQIFVCVDITAPLFWWKEFDTYKVGTVANSTSTMHTLTKHPITLENFSFDVKLPKEHLEYAMCNMITIMHICEDLRQKYLEYKDTDSELAKEYWRMLVEFLPNGWLQTRTITLNYANLRNMYFSRRYHKLREWHTFCRWIEQLPYGKELITYEVKE